MQIPWDATWDYEDQSLMDTGTTASLPNSSRRNRSDSENSDTIHRLWSNFESGGRIMRVKRARGRIVPEEGRVWEGR